MSEESRADCAANSKSGALGHVSDSAGIKTTPFAVALKRLFPPNTPHAEMVEFFHGRTTIGTIRQWRHGRCNPPQWAVETVRAYCDWLSSLAAQTRTNPHGDAKRFKRR